MKHRAPVLNAAILVLVFAVAVAAQSTEIEQLRLAAEQGYARAQYNLGVMYATGRGVLKDRYSRTYGSTSLGANGHAQAHEIRDTVERELTRAEVTRATELARRVWIRTTSRASRDPGACERPIPVR